MMVLLKWKKKYRVKLKFVSRNKNAAKRWKKPESDNGVSHFTDPKVDETVGYSGHNDGLNPYRLDLNPDSEH